MFTKVNLKMLIEYVCLYHYFTGWCCGIPQILW